MSALEAERGGTRVSEGVPGQDWAAVAQVISDRVRELGWRQRELAERSRVSAAVVREIQLHTVERRRSPRTLMRHEALRYIPDIVGRNSEGGSWA